VEMGLNIMIKMETSNPTLFPDEKQLAKNIGDGPRGVGCDEKVRATDIMNADRRRG
jgi:hypothetical protein